MLIKNPSVLTPSSAKSWRRWRPAAAVIGALLTAAIGGAAAIDHDALWKIVHGLCVLDETHLHSPAPCAAVNLEGGEQGGWAVLKDLVGRTQFLLIPTRRLTGIEDPVIGTDSVPNYWAAAWAARGLVAQNARKNLSREEIGMAINGVGARTQDQLHIHVDCVRPDILRALDARMSEIGPRWADFRLLGHAYRARRIEGDAPDPDPFRLLAEDARSAPLREDSLAVIGAHFAGGKPGFILLAEKAPGGATHAENLLDHTCAVAAAG